VGGGGWQGLGAAAIRDRPEWNSAATSQAADLDVRGTAPWHRDTLAQGALDLTWRAGVGADALRGSGAIAQDRARAFVATNAAWHRRQTRLESGVRLDAITQAGVRPSLSFALEQQWTPSFSSAARATQAFRAPTLYDLYGASPQRLAITPLRAERVRADLELASQWRRQTALGRWQVDAALVARETHNAIVWFPGNFGWSPANVGAEQLRGVEARASHVHRWSTVSAWVTRYDAMLRTDALRIPTPYVPRLAAGGEWIAQQRTTVLRLGARYLGDRPYTAGPVSAACYRSRVISR
jgi:outer membrane cobalamin receptor